MEIRLCAWKQYGRMIILIVLYSRDLYSFSGSQPPPVKDTMLSRNFYHRLLPRLFDISALSESFPVKNASIQQL